MSSSGECASCKAPVHWAITPKGSRAPIDYEPSPEKGNVLLVRPNALSRRGPVLLAVVLTGDALELGRLSGHLFTNHWFTCPDKEEWRERTDAKRKAEGGDG